LLLRLPESGFVVVDGKLSQSAADIFDDSRRKKLAVGFYDGTVLPMKEAHRQSSFACAAKHLAQQLKLCATSLICRT
jgi:hypothetical protein